MHTSSQSLMKRRGFTLMEVIFATMLISSVFLALASVFPTALGSLRKSQSLITATHLARGQIEQWRDRDFASIKTVTRPQTSATVLNGVAYAMTVTVSDVTPPDSRIKQLDVQVKWDAGGPAGASVVHDTTCIYDTLNP